MQVVQDHVQWLGFSSGRTWAIVHNISRMSVLSTVEHRPVFELSIRQTYNCIVNRLEQSRRSSCSWLQCLLQWLYDY